MTKQMSCIAVFSKGVFRDALTKFAFRKPLNGDKYEKNIDS